MDMNKSDVEDDFVKNIEEESNEEDDVDLQIDQTIAAYNKKKETNSSYSNIRPESAGNNRPFTGTKKGIESAHVNNTNTNTVTFKNIENERKIESAQPFNSYAAQQQQQYADKTYTSKKEGFYERFNEYVKANHIAPDDFWHPTKNKLSSDEFKECLDIIGFKYTNEEFEDVIFDITDAEFYTIMGVFTKKIACWKLYQAKSNGGLNEEGLDAIKEETLKLVESKKKLLESKKKNILIRPMSSTNFGINRPFSGISAISAKSKITLPSQGDGKMTTMNTTRQPAANKSSVYLKKAKEKEAKVDEVLALTINKGKNEYEYECLVKMGEANEMLQTLGENLTFRAYKSADGNLKCHVYDLDQYVKELTMKEMIREYNQLKIRLRQSQNLKIWDILMQQKKGNKNFNSFKSSSNNTQVNAQGGDKAPTDKEAKPKIVSKSERQTELKNVLFETMKLTNTLKNQLKKLENSGLVFN